MVHDKQTQSLNVIGIAGSTAKGRAHKFAGVMAGSFLLALSLLAAAPAPAAAAAAGDVVAVHALAAAAGAAGIMSTGRQPVEIAAADQTNAPVMVTASRDVTEPAPIWATRMVRSCVRVGSRVSC